MSYIYIYTYTATEVAPEGGGVFDRQPLVWGSLRLAPIMFLGLPIVYYTVAGVVHVL